MQNVHSSCLDRKYREIKRKNSIDNFLCWPSLNVINCFNEMHKPHLTNTDLRCSKLNVMEIMSHYHAYARENIITNRIVNKLSKVGGKTIKTNTNKCDAKCMTACDLNQTFNLTKCLITCKNYNLCEPGCLFYSHIKENDTGC
ncbi:uncharacterized protein LOC124817001 isoform X1 [Hydra vulgaris]|uniref:uncharacterized protein LOC124817001 isoform X1 n=1 Tax=Hydra vulgaris TaxID=6087 RepID=UPI0032EA0FA1